MSLIVVPQTIFNIVTNNVGEFSGLNILSICRVNTPFIIAPIILMSEEKSKMKKMSTNYASQGLTLSAAS